DGLWLITSKEFFDAGKIRRGLRHEGFERKEAVQQCAELLLDRCILGADHSTSNQHGLEANFAHGAHDTDCVRREARNVNDVWIGGLDRSHDRSEVDRIGGKAAIVNHLEPVFLNPYTRADRGGLRKFRIGNRNSHGFWLRIQRYGDVEEALHESHISVGPERENLEILVVAKLL